MTFPVTYLKAKPKTHYPRRHHHRTLFITHPKELGKGIGSDEVEWSVHTPFLASNKYANLRTSKSESSRGDHKNPKTPEWSTYFCAKKSMQASEAMWSVGKETAAKERGRSRRCPPLLGWSAVGCPGGGTRLSRTDYGLRPFLMVAQKGRKHLQQNCPSSRSRREGPLMTAPLHAIHDITKRLGSLSALPPSSNWLG